MGHREDVWTSPVFQEVLMGGINWATQRAEADVTPNIGKVTPNASTLPKFKEAEKKAAPKKDAEKRAN